MRRSVAVSFKEEHLATTAGARTHLVVLDAVAVLVADVRELLDDLLTDVREVEHHQHAQELVLGDLAAPVLVDLAEDRHRAAAPQRL